MQPLPALDVAWYARLLARLADDRRDFVLRRRPVRARASSDWREPPSCQAAPTGSHPPIIIGGGEGSIITVIVGRCNRACLDQVRRPEMGGPAPARSEAPRASSAATAA